MSERQPSNTFLPYRQVGRSVTDLVYAWISYTLFRRAVVVLGLIFIVSLMFSFGVMRTHDASFAELLSGNDTMAVGFNLSAGGVAIAVVPPNSSRAIDDLLEDLVRVDTPIWAVSAEFAPMLFRDSSEPKGPEFRWIPKYVRIPGILAVSVPLWPFGALMLWFVALRVRFAFGHATHR